MPEDPTNPGGLSAAGSRTGEHSEKVRALAAASSILTVARFVVEQPERLRALLRDVGGRYDSCEEPHSGLGRYGSIPPIMGSRKPQGQSLSTGRASRLAG